MSTPNVLSRKEAIPIADNVAITAGSGTSIATDEVGASHHQKVKVEFGENGTATEVSAANPIPAVDAAQKSLLEAIKALLEGTAVVKVTDNAGSLTVDGTVSVGEPTVKVAASQTIGLAAGSAEIGKVKVTENAALVAGTAEIGKVKVTELPTLAAVTTLTTLTGGGKAHDEADAGNPVKVGARARTALPAAVAQDDRTDNISDKHGRQLVTEFPRDQKLEGRLNLTNTTETTILEAAGASTKWVVTGIIVTNSSATVETKVEIKDDTTAKVIVHAGTKGGGAAPPCPPGGFFIGTENKTVKVKAVTTGADVEVFVCGYKVPA